jgi:hypothetical protein
MPTRAPRPADRMFARDGTFVAIFVTWALCVFVVQTGQAWFTTALVLLQDLGVGLLGTGIACPECRFRKRCCEHPSDVV